MNRLFVRTLIAFMMALLVLVGTMSAVFLWGYQRSLSEWSRKKRSGIEDFVQNILTKQPETEDRTVPQDVPLFIYDESKELVFSNRGYGRRRTASERTNLIHVEKNGEVIGYYYSGSMHFGNDEANQKFIESMSRTISFGLLLSMLISFLFALFFSKSLSTPAINVARGLDRITHGNLKVKIPEKGAEEIALIARSANRLGRQLEREQDLRRQWVQNIVHDLRTPISALKAQFEGMRDGVLDLTASRIEKNIREISRIENLVSDLEELMRLESPEMTIKLEEIRVQDFFNEIQNRFSYEITKKNISLGCMSDLDDFMADRNLILRAVTNFLSNAVRHTNINGKIEIVIKIKGKGILIRVANTGDKITQADIDKVFDRLFRGEYARSTPGSGLGLTIAKKIAELHGGTVRIKNQNDTGVAVEMTIPKPDD